MESEIASPLVPTVAVVIVAYASDQVLRYCLDALAAQSRRAEAIIVIDNNSPDQAYLKDIPARQDLKLVFNTVNEGFCIANNRAFQMVSEHHFVVFLNPDAFPRADVLERAVEWMGKPENVRVGILGATLLGFDIGRKQPTGAIDSTGVFQTWYGRWYDRDQGMPWVPERTAAPCEDVPAITGAFMFCRSKALKSVSSLDGNVFDKEFFMYKEDIDLSIRIRNQGWRLAYWPSLICYHCRGWKGRGQVSARARYASARNELRVSFRNRGKGLLYSVLKLAFVPLESLGIRLVRNFSRRRY